MPGVAVFAIVGLLVAGEDAATHGASARALKAAAAAFARGPAGVNLRGPRGQVNLPAAAAEPWPLLPSPSGQARFPSTHSAVGPATVPDASFFFASRTWP